MRTKETIVVGVLAMVYVVPAVCQEMRHEAQQSEPNAPTRQLKGYRAITYPRTGKIATYPVYEEEQSAVRPDAVPTTHPAERPMTQTSTLPVQRQEESPDLGSPLRRDVWDIGPEIFYHRYEEYDEDGFQMMHEEGIMYGVYFAYTHRDYISTSSERNQLKGGWMFAAEGNLSYGEVDYDGATQSGESLEISGVDDSIAELRLLLGLDSLTGADLVDTIYAGVGCRYWNDDLSCDPAGYERESTYLYLPVGLACIKEGTGGWFHGPKMEFDWLLSGEQVSHLSDVGFTDVENQQKDGYGFRISYSFHKMDKQSELTIEPFLRYWEIKESEVEFVAGGAVIEPDNETREVGVRLLWRFK